jgi:hypothetical protein
MISFYQLQRCSTKEVIFVGNYSECNELCRRANALTTKSTVEIQIASLESIAKKDELGNKRIFLFQDGGKEHVLHHSTSRMTDDHDCGICSWPPDYGREGDYGARNPIDEHMEYGHSKINYKNSKERVQEYLEKLNHKSKKK